MNNHTATPLGDSSHSVATDLPHRPAPVASARSALPAPERRRSAAGSNSILNISNGSASESVSGETPLAPHDHRSSLSHNALRTSSSSSLGGSPIIAMGDPHHQRAPSLGELHQELEQEQEAQVNRLLLLIRSQQTQLQQLQQQQQQLSGGTAVLDDASPPSERTVPFPPVPPHPASGGRSSTQLASSLSSRRPSRPSSQVGSPSLRPRADSSRGPEALEWIGGTGESPARRGSRDESAYYQAEATMLARENQMLRQRIRELERQVSDFTLGAQSSQSSVPSSRPETDVASPQEPAGRGSASDLSDKT